MPSRRKILDARSTGDSVGGEVECIVRERQQGCGLMFGE